jgi:antitoxin HicB
MRYPFDLNPDGTGFLVTFPDIPEAITQAKTVEEASKFAKDALETAFEIYFENDRAIPMPSPVEPKHLSVEIRSDLDAAIMASHG